MESTPAHRFPTPAAARAFALAGRAVLTLQSEKTGVHFTYQVRRAEADKPLWYVSVLNGPEHFAYMAVLDGAGPRATRKSKVPASSPAFRAFAYWWQHTAADKPAPHCAALRRAARGALRPLPPRAHPPREPGCRDRPGMRQQDGVRVMGINGSVGRARTMARIRRDNLRDAKNAGIDTTDRKATAAYLWEKSKQMLLGIGDRARCRCGGDNHDVITKTKGI